MGDGVATAGQLDGLGPVVRKPVSVLPKLCEYLLSGVIYTRPPPPRTPQKICFRIATPPAPPAQRMKYACVYTHPPPPLEGVTGFSV